MTTLPLGWVWPNNFQMGLVLFAGVLLGVATYLTIESLRFGEVGLVSPFRYTAMVWAVLFGYVFFDAVPDRWVAAGSSLVIAAGLYLLHHEITIRSRPREGDAKMAVNQK